MGMYEVIGTDDPVEAGLGCLFIFGFWLGTLPPCALGIIGLLGGSFPLMALAGGWLVVWTLGALAVPKGG